MKLSYMDLGATKFKINNSNVQRKVGDMVNWIPETKLLTPLMQQIDISHKIETISQS